MDTTKTLLLFVLLILLMSQTSEKPKPITISRNFDSVYEIEAFIKGPVNRDGYRIVNITFYTTVDRIRDPKNSFLVIAEK